MVVSLPKESSLPLLKLFGNGEIPAGVTSQAEKNCTYVQSVTNSFFSLKQSHESAPGGLGSQSLWTCWNLKGTKHLFFFFFRAAFIRRAARQGIEKHERRKG